MKKRFIILFSYVLCAPYLFAQSNKFIHPSIFEIQFSLSDYKTSQLFANPKAMYGGIGIAFTKGINNHLDWRISFNASYADSVIQKQIIRSDKALMIQADIVIRARMSGYKTVVQPYIITGAGFSKYKNYFGAYMPAGAGLQVSLFREVYLLSDLQYRLPITHNFKDHFFYSIGLAGTIGRRKPALAPQKKTLIPTIIISVRDSDNDGIVDAADACPSEPGLAKFNGCPDTDGDGIVDKDDHCPIVYGLLRYQGCPVPDADKDGVNDEEDKCIDIPGVKENAGCPLVKEDLKKQIDLAAQQIYFRTGSAELLPGSFASLDEIVKILKQETAAKLSIEGHTDNEGTPTSNQSLSERRAQSVLEYLKTHGVSATRLIAKGFGQAKPVADNSTPEARTKNRRVELHLSY